MNWLAFVLQLLPVAITATEKIAGDAAGHQKKQIVSDAIDAAVAGVATVAPGEGDNAAEAAKVAKSAIDGTVKLLNDAGVLQHAKSAPAPVAPAPVPFQVQAQPTPMAVSVTHQEPAPVVEPSEPSEPPSVHSPIG